MEIEVEIQCTSSKKSQAILLHIHMKCNLYCFTAEHFNSDIKYNYLSFIHLLSTHFMTVCALQFMMNFTLNEIRNNDTVTSYLLSKYNYIHWIGYCNNLLSKKHKNTVRHHKCL